MLIVDKLDRLFRSVRDFENTILGLHQRGIRFCVVNLGGISLDSQTPMGMLVLRMMAIFAELESQMRGERYRDTARVRRMTGKYPMSGLSWLFDADSEGCVVVPQETLDLARMAVQHEQHSVTVAASREILEEYWCKKHGKPYRKSAFHKYKVTNGSVHKLRRIGHLLVAGVAPEDLWVALQKAD